jgi:hypothetical protein
MKAASSADERSEFRITIRAEPRVIGWYLGSSAIASS